MVPTHFLLVLLITSQPLRTDIARKIIIKSNSVLELGITAAMTLICQRITTIFGRMTTWRNRHCTLKLLATSRINLLTSTPDHYKADKFIIVENCMLKMWLSFRGKRSRKKKIDFNAQKLKSELLLTVVNIFYCIFRYHHHVFV